MNNNEKDKAAQAKDLFKQGYNCAQAVLCSFCAETGLSFDNALKIASSFGGGMGRLREVCGAVSAMFMVAGIKYGYTSNNDNKLKREHYKLIQDLAQEFKAECGSIVCRRF